MHSARALCSNPFASHWRCNSQPLYQGLSEAVLQPSGSNGAPLDPSPCTVCSVCALVTGPVTYHSDPSGSEWPLPVIPADWRTRCPNHQMYRIAQVWRWLNEPLSQATHATCRQEAAAEGAGRHVRICAAASAGGLTHQHRCRSCCAGARWEKQQWGHADPGCMHGTSASHRHQRLPCAGSHR
jgi:hypothetical protein